MQAADQLTRKHKSQGKATENSIIYISLHDRMLMSVQQSGTQWSWWFPTYYGRAAWPLLEGEGNIM